MIGNPGHRPPSDDSTHTISVRLPETILFSCVSLEIVSSKLSSAVYPRVRFAVVKACRNHSVIPTHAKKSGVSRELGGALFLH